MKSISQQVKDWRTISIKLRRIELVELSHMEKANELTKVDQLQENYISNYGVPFDPLYEPTK